jgi:uncharacterized protein (DUF302 family)
MMPIYCTSFTTDRPFDTAIADVRVALGAEGFGVLTEIDVRATMKAKLAVEVPAQVILGACNPQLAHRALAVEPSLGTLLPCNVVVRNDGGRTVVEAIDPMILVSATGNGQLEPIAREVSAKLRAALDSLAEREEEAG